MTAVDYDEQFATVTVTLDTTNLSAVETLLPFAPTGEYRLRLPAGGRPSCPMRRVYLVGPDGSNLLETLSPNDLGNAVE